MVEPPPPPPPPPPPRPQRTPHPRSRAARARAGFPLRRFFSEDTVHVQPRARLWPVHCGPSSWSVHVAPVEREQATAEDATSKRAWRRGSRLPLAPRGHAIRPRPALADGVGRGPSRVSRHRKRRSASRRAGDVPKRSLSRPTLYARVGRGSSRPRDTTRGDGDVTKRSLSRPTPSASADVSVDISVI